MAGAPEAETVELLPPGEPAYEDAQVAVAEAFAATPAPEPSLETASVPVTDHAEERAVFVEHRPEPAAPVDAEPEHAPRQYDVPPAHEDTSPPANPRRGWWRR
jgi:ribonuclease E